MLQYVVRKTWCQCWHIQTNRQGSNIPHTDPWSSQWAPWKFNLFSLHLPSPSPIPNDQYISVLRQENNNHSRELISSFLKPYNITVHFINMDFCCKICILNLQNPLFILNFSKPCVWNNIFQHSFIFYLSFQKSLSIIRLIFSSLHTNHNHNISLSKKNNAWESMNIRLSLLM